LSALVLSLSSLGLFIAPHAFAAAKTWTGTAGDHKFNTAGNWSPSGAPSNGDTLDFPNDVTDLAPDNDIVGLSVAGITFSGAGTSGGFTITGNDLTLTGDITDTTSDTFVTNTLSLNVALSGTPTFTVPAGHFIAVPGVLSGSGNLTKAGNGTLELQSANTGTGTFMISAGQVLADNAASLGNSSAGTTVSDGAGLLFCFSSDITVAEPITVGGVGIANGALGVAGCGGPGNITKTATLTGAVVLTADTQVAGGSANTLKLTGSLNGAHHITVVDGANVTLDVEASPNNSLTSNGVVKPTPVTTTVSAGDDQSSLAVNVGPNSIYVIDGTRGDTLVLDGGVLKGTGTVGALTVANGGIVAPGHSPGCLNTGNLLAGGTYQAEIGGKTACTEYDQIKVTGTVDVTGGTLDVSIVNGFKPVVGQKYTIISNDGSDAVSGTFTGLAEGATITVGTTKFSISYKGGDGNDVVLTVTAGAPDTGFSLVSNSPFVGVAVMLGAAGAIGYMACRSLQPAVARRKR